MFDPDPAHDDRTGAQGPEESEGVGARQTRSCVACRKPADRHALLRFVLGPADELLFDATGKLPGRGAHTCCDPACIRQAVVRRGFDRAFHRQVRAGNPEQLLERIANWNRMSLLNLLGLCRRSGRLLAGGDEVERGLERGEVKLLVLAEDLAFNRRVDLIRRTQVRPGTIPVLQASTLAELGRAVGRPPTGILGVSRGPQLAPLLLLKQRLEAFGRTSGAQPPSTETNILIEPAQPAQANQAVDPQA